MLSSGGIFVCTSVVVTRLRSWVFQMCLVAVTTVSRGVLAGISVLTLVHAFADDSHEIPTRELTTVVFVKVYTAPRRVGWVEP